ncbi:hypothetical protein C8R47DRAFT_604296 [Mycena vitilis]|nr:hypothetical protein C8R47DRAFT_604296 [Mycena vitilis]
MIAACMRWVQLPLSLCARSISSTGTPSSVDMMVRARLDRPPACDVLGAAGCVGLCNAASPFARVLGLTAHQCLWVRTCACDCNWTVPPISVSVTFARVGVWTACTPGNRGTPLRLCASAPDMMGRRASYAYLCATLEHSQGHIFISAVVRPPLIALSPCRGAPPRLGCTLLLFFLSFCISCSIGHDERYGRDRIPVHLSHDLLLLHRRLHGRIRPLLPAHPLLLGKLL